MGGDAQPGDTWESCVPAMEICWVRPLRKGWVSLLALAVSASPIPLHLKVRKSPLCSLSCPCRDVSPFGTDIWRPTGVGQCSVYSFTPLSPRPPSHRARLGHWGHLNHTENVPRIGTVGQPNCLPPKRPLPAALLLSPAPVLGPCAIPLAQTAVPLGGGEGSNRHHMSLLNPSHSWVFLQEPTCPPAH